MLVSVDRRKVAKISFVIAAMLAAVCAEGAFAGTQNTSDTTKDRLAALETTVAQQAALITALQSDLADTKTTVGSQQTSITTLQSGLATTNSELAEAKSVTDAVKPLAPYLTFDSEDNIYLTGANLHIRSGSGHTAGEVNGLGNLIVGYNENYPGSPATGSPAARTGSHNLVVGPYHSYSSYGGLVAGYMNTISGDYSSVSGGRYGTASGYASSVSGGEYGTASGNYSSVSGGAGGIASGTDSSVSGGYAGTASGNYSSVSGGTSGSASGYASSVSGGYVGTASGDYSSVSGGYVGTASGEFSSVSGGQNQTADTQYSYAP